MGSVDFHCYRLPGRASMLVHVMYSPGQVLGEAMELHHKGRCKYGAYSAHNSYSKCLYDFIKTVNIFNCGITGLLYGSFVLRGRDLSTWRLDLYFLILRCNIIVNYMNFIYFLFLHHIVKNDNSHIKFNV